MTHKDAHLARMHYRSRCEGWTHSRMGFYYAQVDAQVDKRRVLALRQPLSILTPRVLR